MLVFYIFAILLLMASGTSAVKCTPGHTYNDGCNDCTCTDKGDGYACTLKFCEGNPIFCDTRGTTRRCRIGHRYFDGCNWCTCPDGRQYSCEEKACYYNPVSCYVR